MKDFVCPFCGSKKLLIDQPTLKPTRTWPRRWVPEKAFCCKAQAKNQEYIDKNYDEGIAKQFKGKVPTLEEVSKE